ncbi:hypothetical protein Tco_0995177 [Tanacetum coccineum]
MILTTNTPYPSRKIRRICAYTHQRPQGKEGQYAVSREGQYAILDIWHVNILEDIKRGPYSKKLQYAAGKTSIPVRDDDENNSSDVKCDPPVRGPTIVETLYKEVHLMFETTLKLDDLLVDSASQRTYLSVIIPLTRKLVFGTSPCLRFVRRWIVFFE